MINLKNIQLTRGTKQIFDDYNLTLNSPGLNIIEGKYSDYHICRPYSKHKEFNDEIVELLKKIK